MVMRGSMGVFRGGSAADSGENTMHGWH